MPLIKTSVFITSIGRHFKSKEESKYKFPVPFFSYFLFKGEEN